MPERPVVVITGASGPIDTRLPSLIAPDYTVAAQDVEQSPTRFSAQAGLFHCDLTNDASTEQAVFEEVFIKPWMIDLADAHYPVFGSQSMRVLGSDVSYAMRGWLGIPDAAVGALAYLGDAIFGLAGSTRRWQLRPWLVVVFGIDVIPLGIVSAVLFGANRAGREAALAPEWG